ncbi:MAG: hydrogenase iron-sulfur subunit [bacterium]|nr:hydrogenase iron-sulfur subunit [bacterium]
MPLDVVKDTSFKPDIIAFCCSRSLPDAAKLIHSESELGVNLKLLPCSSKIEVAHLITIFESGVDGVMIAGCLGGTCQFLDGNLLAKGRVAYLKKLLSKIGLEEERVEIYFLDPAKKEDFSKASAEFLAGIKNIGPNPLKYN